MNTRKKFGKFKIEFTVNMEELSIHYLDNNPNKHIKNGIVSIEYKIG